MDRLTGWRGFLAVWAGQAVSRIGSVMYAFGVGVFVYEKTGSATLFGLILFFELLPGVLVLLILEKPAHALGTRVLFLLQDVVFLPGRRAREQHLGLDVCERSRHHQVLARHVDAQNAHQGQVLEVLFGDEADRNVEDVELMLLNQVQEQVERPLEAGACQLEPVLALH